MKRDMFYNYEHNINKKEYPQILDFTKQPDICEGYAGTRIITNIKNNIIGVSAHKGSPIDLYFYVNGDIDGDVNLAARIKDASLTILDTCHNELINLTMNESCQLVDNQLYFRVVDSENKLKQDIYKLKLIVNIDGDQYTLFSEADGFLEIL